MTTYTNLTDEPDPVPLLRPWWWWINPWLYIARRDRAYVEALDALRDAARENYRLMYPKRTVGRAEEA